MVYKNRKRGFTLIEGIVTLAVFAFLTVTFYKVFTQTATQLGDSKQRRAASALLNERMEHYRNLPYDDIGTTLNAPFGNIVGDETAMINDITFRIISSVFFVDDRADTSAPADMLFEDYKRVSVTIVWDDCVNASVTRSVAEFGAQCQNKRMRIVSQFVPPGGLETSVTGGILSMNAIDSDGLGVAGAQMEFYDSVSDTTFSEPVDGTGNYMYIGAPECVGCYEITASLAGYETVKTEDPYNGTTQMYNPRFAHQSVVEGVMTTSSMTINQLSTFDVVSQNPFSTAVPDVNFDVVGGRVLGTDPNNGGAEVYGLNSSFVTNASGEYTIRTDTDSSGTVTSSDDANPGSYTFTLNEPGYTFWKMVPGDDSDAAIVNLDAGTDLDAEMVILDDAYGSFFIKVEDDGGDPVEGADVKVENTALGYDVTLQTDAYGYVFFPENETDVLIDSEVYDITVDATGFGQETDTATFDVSTLQALMVVLN